MNKEKKNRSRIIELVASIESGIEAFNKSGVVSPTLCEINKKFLPSFILPANHIRIEMVESYLKKIKKQVYRLTAADYDWVITEMFKLNFVVLTALSEAEKVCAQLCLSRITDATLSDDSDLFAYFCPKVLAKFNLLTQSCQIINFDKLLEQLQFSREQFLDFCIMCGTDFNKNIPGIGTHRSYEYIQEYKSIEAIAKETKLDVSILNYVRVRELYKI